MFIIPINDKPYYNTEPMANTIASNDMFDCYMEAVPNVGYVTRRRPGLKKFADLGTGVKGDGLFYWDAKRQVIAISGGQAFSLASDGTVTTLLNEDSGAATFVGNPVIFSDGLNQDGSPWLYMASGNLVYTEDGVNLLIPSDPDTPPATHVSWIDQKFIANVYGSSLFRFTDVNPDTGFFDNGFWSGANNPVVCDAKGDKLSALFVGWQEVYAWGSEGLQIFQDDGVTPFVNMAGSYAEIGLEAPYSIAKAGNTIFGLGVIDNKRCVFKLKGRSPEIVSEPIARTIAEMATVSDAIGDLISVGGIAIYLLQFPSENQTWAYDHKGDIWYRWGYWNGEAHDAFLGQHACFVKPWNKHLIMSRRDGKIYEMSRDFYDDDGDTMVTFRRSGWVDHATSWRRKRSDQLYIKAKVKELIEGETFTLMFRWRSDGHEEWSPWVELALNPQNQGDFLFKLNRMGTYRTRQYEFRITDNIDLVLVGATEMITELRN